jgi:predicted nucleic acid-binding protein
MTSLSLQNVYLDTQFLYAYITESNRENEKRISNIVQKVISNHNPNISIIIPFIVVGETINIMMLKLNPDEQVKSLDTLTTILRNERVDMSPPTEKILRMASDLSRKDRDLKDTDAMIVSHAICDEHSSLLLTSDTVLLYSYEIDKMCKTWRSENGYPPLIIRDSF